VESGDADGPEAGPARGPNRRRVVAVVATVTALVLIDQLTKIWAVAALSDGPTPVIGDTVELRLTRNPGGAFGRFQGMTVVLAVGAIAISVFLVRTLRRATDPLLVAGLSFVLAGALGNLTDRLVRSPGFLRGEVVDFVSVGWWPVFNVADSCLTIGAVLLAIHALRAPHPEPAERG
jgi:signal peptidase II